MPYVKSSSRNFFYGFRILLQISKLSAETETLEKDIIMKKKTLEMLPDATDNIGRCKLYFRLKFWLVTSIRS